MADWQSERRARDERLNAGSKFAEGKMVAPDDATALLEAVVRPGDRICLEGDNQKQADFLAACLAKANPKVLHDLHVVQSGIVLPEHIDLFEKGIAKKLDFSFSGPQSDAVARVLKSGKDRARRNPHLHRVVRPLLRRPYASRRVDRRSQRRPRRAIFTWVRTRRTLPSSSKRPLSSEASSSRRSMRWWTSCRGWTFRATASISWSWRQSLSTSSRCSLAIRPASRKRKSWQP